MSDIEEVDEEILCKLEDGLEETPTNDYGEDEEDTQSFRVGDFVTDEEFANLDLHTLQESDDEASRLLEGSDQIRLPEDDNNTNGSRMRFRLGHLIYCIYFLGVSIPIAVVGTINAMESKKHGGGHKTCDQPLQEWTWIFLGFQSLTLIVETYLAYVIKPMMVGQVEENLTITQRLHRKLVYFFERVLNLFWLFWFIMGMVWTFRSKQCTPRLYHLCLALIILHLSFIGLAFLFCCCSLMCMGVLYMLHPTLFRGENRGASDKVIGKTTEEVVFDVGMYETDDAKCAICLSDYNDGDKLRTLPCKHHFHTECVDEWLHRNKSCPYCKRIIDADEEQDETSNV